MHIRMLAHPWRVSIIAVLLGTLVLTGFSVALADEPVQVPAGNVAELVAEITTANLPGAPATIIDLTASDYELTEIDNTGQGSNGLPVITGNITINGNGAAIWRASAEEFRIFAIGSGGQLHLDGVTISGGAGTSFGGGIYNDGGTVTLSDSVVTGNAANFGGGIFNNGGTVTLFTTTVIENTATFNSGGGIYNAGTGAVLTLNDSIVTGNNAGLHGGGIFNSNARSVLNTSVVHHNTAASQGGGIGNSGAAGIVETTASTISDNEAGVRGGGIDNFVGIVNLIASTVSDNEAGQGGGIYSVGANSSLTLTDSDIRDNDATSQGGGIRNSGTTVTLNNSLVRDNTVAGDGGGIYNGAGSGSVNLSGSTVSGNQAGARGGGIDNFGGTVNLTGSTISGNTATSEGGGLSNFVTMSVSNSTIDGNRVPFGSGGGIVNRGTLELTDTTVSNNVVSNNGGGILSTGTIPTVTITGSTLNNNEADAGGGIFVSRGTAELTNSTISGNSANSIGGGAYTFGPGVMALSSSTVSGNTAAIAGGGIRNFDGTLTLNNSLIGGGNTANFGPDVLGDVEAGSSYNLVRDGSGMTGLTNGDEYANQVGDADNPIEPLLGPLRDNGGPTETRALLSGSPAINAIPEGVNGCNTTIVTDQRGVDRPQGTGCDIGAFEVSVDEQFQSLLDGIQEGVTHSGTRQSLMATISAAQESIAIGDLTTGCNQLEATANQVRAQSGKRLTSVQADDLLAEISSIRGLLGC